MDHVTSDENFKMPDLTKLSNKALQLNALRDIRSCAATSFKILDKQKNALKALLHGMQPSRNRGMSLGIQSAAEHDNNSELNSLNNYNSRHVNFEGNNGSNFAYSER